MSIHVSPWARRAIHRLRRLRLQIAIAAALLLLAILVTTVTIFAPSLAIFLSILAVLMSGAAAVVERWLFFAEAQHVVSLYYGAERA